MKFWNKFLLLVAVLYVCATVWPVVAAETAPEASTADKEAAKIPDSTDMTLGMKASPYALPEQFRGGDPDSGLVHCLEDVYYEKHEHSLIYNPDASSLAEGAKFESEPNITWETKVKDADGNFKTLSAENTNMAADGGKFFAPAEYQVGNHGAREVGGGETGAEDVTEGTGPEAGGGETDTTEVTTGTEPGGEAGGSESTTSLATAEEPERKTVTAEQNMGVLVHDCTSPDMWVAFQEGAGKVDMAETEEELKKEMTQKIIANLGRPFSQNGDDFEKASYLFLDEGLDDERNLEPWNKTARLSIAGPLFNEVGAPKFESGTLRPTVGKEDFVSQVHVTGKSDNALKGVYVRRNVPFIFAAMAVDNGDNRASAADAACRIEYADGKEVDKTENAYLFRVPNYPREEYKDQPEFFFVAKAKDKEGNISTIRMPLYIVDQQAAFEGGRNQ